MDSQQEQVFDNVKFEKAKAMAKYNRFRKMMKLLQFLEVLVVITLISWSSSRLPGAVKISRRILFGVANYLCNPHVVFVIGNAIIVTIFVLCRGGAAVSASANSGDDDDLQEEYVHHSQAHVHDQFHKVVDSGEVKISPPELVLDTAEMKEVIAEPGGSGDGDGVEEKHIMLWSEEKAEQRDAVTTAIETAAKQIEKFQRTQSEKLKREIAGGELRRSETVRVGRGRTERPKMPSLDTVDKLSDEEFNAAIEAAIKRHQKSLMEQKIAENEEFQKGVRKSYRCASVR